MSREVRRVPVGWQHPVEWNPYWERQEEWRRREGRPPSRLHGPTKRFRALMRSSISEAIAEWEREKEEWEAGTHEHLVFSLLYHDEAGYLNHEGEREAPRPYIVYAEDGETEVRRFFPKSVGDLLEVYPYSEYAGDRPVPEDYMPDFTEPEDDLGWCLYQTVSEGTPVTPVFATAEELVEHLVTVGQDYDQVPMRRASAEAIVSSGGTLGSMVVVGGQLLQSDQDADKIDELMSGPAKVRAITAAPEGDAS